MNYYTENMKRLLTLFACFFCINIGVFAARQDETVLRGSLVDASGDPVGFATAYLSSADGRVVSGVTTGEDGRFELRSASGDWSDYTGSATWTCAPADDAARAAFSSVTATIG